MRIRFLVAMVVSLVAAAVPAQSPMLGPDSPKQIIDEYFRMEADGGRLTAAGWRRAGSFFIRPDALRKNKQIVVIDKRYAVWQQDPPTDEQAVAVISKGYPTWQQSKREARAIVVVEYIPMIEIDSKLCFTTSKSPKSDTMYFVVRTDKHWELDPAGGPLKEVRNPPRWLIDGSDDVISITPDVAIHYLRGARDKARDPLIKANADSTIKELLRIR